MLEFWHAGSGHHGRGLRYQALVAHYARRVAQYVNPVAGLALIGLVVNAVKGDPEEGEDGEFYEALGYVRKSERKSGLSRGKKPAPVPA